MSYLAIARKYRPASFEGMVGQDHVTRTLRNALERGRIHHGYLFTGARGVGKTTAARAFARSLNCVKGPTASPCGECLSCREITSGTSPDLIEIDGASNNSVDDIRELRDTVRYAPTHGKYKIYLVDEVHMLSKGAFNALLKTLEEPPAHVVFIFATTEANRIPETILSRVQRFDFKRMPVQVVVDRLGDIAGREGVRISEGALKLIARAGEGSMRDAESLLDQVLAASGTEITDQDVVSTLGLVDRGLLYDTLAGLISGEPDRCLDAIDQVYRYGYELSQFTAELLEVLRNATFLRLSEGARRHVDLGQADVTRLDELVQGVDPEVLTRLFSALIDVHDQVSRSERPRIVLDMAVARLASVRPLEPVASLLARLEQLERRSRQGGGGAPPKGLRGAEPSRPAQSRTSASRSAPEAAPPLRTPEPPPRVPAKEPVAAAPTTPVVATPPPPAAPPPTAPKPMAPDGRAASDPWKAVLAAARGLPGAEDLSAAEAVVENGTLRVLVKGGRSQAVVKRAVALPAVADALARGYPGRVVDVAVRSGPEADDPEARLRRQALEDPAVKRIVETLGADLVSIQPLDDGEFP